MLQPGKPPSWLCELLVKAPISLLIHRAVLMHLWSDIGTLLWNFETLPSLCKWWKLLWTSYLYIWKFACGNSQILNRSTNIYISIFRWGFPFLTAQLTLILRRSRTGTVWFYTSTSNKRAARPKLYTKSLTRDFKHMYSRLTLVRISINL